MCVTRDLELSLYEHVPLVTTELVLAAHASVSIGRLAAVHWKVLAPG
jgi:hypothetical protein